MEIDIREIRKPTPYNAFVKLNMPGFVLKNPGVSHKDVVLELARTWFKIRTPEMTADTVPKIF